MHPHVEIVALSIRRTDMRHVGFARDRRLDSAGALGGAVAARGSFRGLPPYSFTSMA